jgi:hypothetical protein
MKNFLMSMFLLGMALANNVNPVSAQGLVIEHAKAEPIDRFVLTPLLYFGPIVFVVVGSLAVILALSIKEGKRQQFSRSVRLLSGATPMAISSAAMGEQLLDRSGSEFKPIFSVTILQSSDRSLVGQRFDLPKQTAHLGSSAWMDIFSPKDAGLNENHAVIETRDGQFILRRGNSTDGSPAEVVKNAPLFVNDQPVIGETTIDHGDTIRIGKTLAIRLD